MLKILFQAFLTTWCIAGFISWGFECARYNYYRIKIGFWYKITGIIFNIIFGFVSLYCELKSSPRLFGWRIW